MVCRLVRAHRRRKRRSDKSVGPALGGRPCNRRYRAKPGQPGWRPRKARLIGIHTMCSTGRWLSPSLSPRTAVLHICQPRRGRAPSGSTYPPLVIVVLLTLSMLGACNV